MTPYPRRLPGSARPPRRALRRRDVLAAGAVLPLSVTALAACGGDEEGGDEPDLRADLPREEPGPVEGTGALVSPFSARLLGALPRDETNLVCSPLSVQVALTMAGLGAAGDTRAQLEAVLGGEIDELARAANSLSAVLSEVGDAQREEAEEEAPEPARASLVSGTWMQEGLDVEQEFLEQLAAHFGSGVHEVDFTDETAREEGRQRLNAWVEDETGGMIEELLPEGVLGALTRMVLVNALHLRAAWPSELGRAEGSFRTAQGQELDVEMLRGTARAWYEDDLVRATALGTYGDQLALALIHPVQDLDAVLEEWAEAADGGDALAALIDGLEDSTASVDLTLPSFDISWDEDLKGHLDQLGITDAFTDAADFSGITASEELMITSVVHKGVIAVDEEGMEAAAATAVVADATSAQVRFEELVLDSPFLYVAYERSSRAPLVLGWIGDPTATR